MPYRYKKRRQYGTRKKATYRRKAPRKVYRRKRTTRRSMFRPQPIRTFTEQSTPTVHSIANLISTTGEFDQRYYIANDAFAMSLCPSFTNWITQYKEFKILSVIFKVEIIPSVEMLASRGMGSFEVAFILTTVPFATLPTFTDFDVQPVIRRKFTAEHNTTTIKFSPKPQVNIYQTSVSNSHATMRNVGWIPVDDYITPHFGLAYRVTNFRDTSVAVDPVYASCRISAYYKIAFRGIKP